MKKYSYSLDNERFRGDFDSIEEALDDATANADDASTVFIGENIPINPGDYLDFESLIDCIEESIGDNNLFIEDGVGEILEIDDRDAMEKELREVIAQHCKCNFFEIGKTTEHEIHD